jgi:hypothetical protein
MKNHACLLVLVAGTMGCGLSAREMFLPTAVPPFIFPNCQREISPLPNPGTSFGRQNQKSRIPACSLSRRRIPLSNVWWAGARIHLSKLL